MAFDFSTQYSSFPLFHHSMWMAPTSPANYAHGQRYSPRTQESPDYFSLDNAPLFPDDLVYSVSTFIHPSSSKIFFLEPQEIATGEV